MWETRCPGEKKGWRAQEPLTRGKKGWRAHKPLKKRGRKVQSPNGGTGVILGVKTQKKDRVCVMK